MVTFWVDVADGFFRTLERSELKCEILNLVVVSRFSYSILHLWREPRFFIESEILHKNDNGGKWQLFWKTFKLKMIEIRKWNKYS